MELMEISLNIELRNGGNYGSGLRLSINRIVPGFTLQQTAAFFEHLDILIQKLPNLPVPEQGEK